MMPTVLFLKFIEDKVFLAKRFDIRNCSRGDLAIVDRELHFPTRNAILQDKETVLSKGDISSGQMRQQILPLACAVTIPSKCCTSRDKIVVAVIEEQRIGISHVEHPVKLQRHVKSAIAVAFFHACRLKSHRRKFHTISNLYKRNATAAVAVLIECRKAIDLNAREIEKIVTTGQCLKSITTTRNQVLVIPIITHGNPFYRTTLQSSVYIHLRRMARITLRYAMCNKSRSIPLAAIRHKDNRLASQNLLFVAAMDYQLRSRAWRTFYRHLIHKTAQLNLHAFFLANGIFGSGIIAITIFVLIISVTKAFIIFIVITIIIPIPTIFITSTPVIFIHVILKALADEIIQQLVKIVTVGCKIQARHILILRRCSY